MTDERLLNIIRSVPQFSERPGFTSGRGATLSDLCSKRLEKIYQGIKKEFGNEAADAMVQMVQGIKVLSATTFLVELYALCNNGWKYTPKEEDASGMTLDKDKNGEYNVGQGMGAVISGMFSGGRDDTELIRQPFLRSRGIEIPWEKRRPNIYGF